MKTLCVLAVLTALAIPAMVSAEEAPAAPAPATASNLLDAIFADEGGPCIYICAISRVCACDPPVTIQCAGCRSCNQNMFGIVCDGVLTSCPPCVW
jgi:hypothetical protein